MLQVNEDNGVEDLNQDIANMADAEQQQAHIELMAAAQEVAQQQQQVGHDLKKQNFEYL